MLFGNNFVFLHIMDNYDFSIEELRTVAAHVKATYPGTSLRTYLSDVGFDMSNVPEDALIAVGNYSIYNIEFIVVDDWIAPRAYCNFPSISVDDTNINTSERDCFKIVSEQNREPYAEVLSDAYVTNFQIA